MILIVVGGTIPTLSDGEGIRMVWFMLLKTRKLQKISDKFSVDLVIHYLMHINDNPLLPVMKNRGLLDMIAYCLKIKYFNKF